MGKAKKQSQKKQNDFALLERKAVERAASEIKRVSFTYKNRPKLRMVLMDSVFEELAETLTWRRASELWEAVIEQADLREDG